MTIQRYSSRTHRLDNSFLLKHLKHARSYRRIAGYFTSSLFEVANELLTSVPEVQIVCNVDIHPKDLKIAQLRETKLISRWNDWEEETEILLNRQRYQRLDSFLAKHTHAVRIAPNSICGFLHGKAGVIQLTDGRKIGFIGSMNETRSGWQSHYEILWEDDSEEGVSWIEEEFAYLWNAAQPLSKAVIREVRRRRYRREVLIDEIDQDEELGPATLIESPLYREGFSLKPWQQSFVSECLRQYRIHGNVRLLLADEVGLGKTLSLATAALVLCLLAEKKEQPQKPIAIFVPATLCEQWQTELMDKLGIPSARWETHSKTWLDESARRISPRGHEQILKCPMRIGIISTGLMTRDSMEKQHMLELSYELVILDEAHKARRRQGVGRGGVKPNELLGFMHKIASRSDHVLLATATPIQTQPEDLWDLMGILNQGKGSFIFGNDFTRWHRPKDVLPYISGEYKVIEATKAWELLRSPLPFVDESQDSHSRLLYSAIRQDLAATNDQIQSNSPYAEISEDTREILDTELNREIEGTYFFQRENPFIRHVVLRKRTYLESLGLLPKVGVDVHPERKLASKLQQFDSLFEAHALRTSEDFREAYGEARRFGKELAKRGMSGGFMRNLMEQRVCSSIRAGLNTARMLLAGQTLHEDEDDQEIELKLEAKGEKEILSRLIERLVRIKSDPKFHAVLHYLERENWLNLGIVIFSQYYDTSKWLAESLSERYPKEAIGLYSGASRSRLYHKGENVRIERETLKRMVAEHEIRIMVATDAACEGLNLQTLGSVINIDLPWNPTKLEQRIGRIKRFGQVREKVKMLNLVNEQTVEERVYERLSERMRDRYNLFGSLPDIIKDDWIEDIETLGEKMDDYINATRTATGFDLRYSTTVEPIENDWRDCSDVLSRRDLSELMNESWRSQ